jgi:ArsR family transcriptional regulator
MSGALPTSAPKAGKPALQRAAVRLAALAQPSRLAIVRHLIQAGPAGITPGALALALEIRPSTLSFHLKELLHCGLVQAQPQGRHIVYRAGYVQMRELIEFLTVHCCAGTPCELTSSSAPTDHTLPDHASEDANCCPPPTTPRS